MVREQVVRLLSQQLIMVPVMEMYPFESLQQNTLYFTVGEKSQQKVSFLQHCERSELRLFVKVFVQKFNLDKLYFLTYLNFCAKSIKKLNFRAKNLDFYPKLDFQKTFAKANFDNFPGKNSRFFLKILT